MLQASCPKPPPFARANHAQSVPPVVTGVQAAAYRDRSCALRMDAFAPLDDALNLTEKDQSRYVPQPMPQAYQRGKAVSAGPRRISASVCEFSTMCAPLLNPHAEIGLPLCVHGEGDRGGGGGGGGGSSRR